MRLETYSIERLKKLRRPPEYLADYLACAEHSNVHSVTIDRDSECARKLYAKYAAWREKLAPPQLPPPEMPVELLTEQERVGLGDLIETGIKAVGLDVLAKWYEKTTGQSCGCKTRREFLNRIKLWRKGQSG